MNMSEWSDLLEVEKTKLNFGCKVSVLLIITIICVLIIHGLGHQSLNLLPLQLIVIISTRREVISHLGNFCFNIGLLWVVHHVHCPDPRVAVELHLGVELHLLLGQGHISLLIGIGLVALIVHVCVGLVVLVVHVGVVEGRVVLVVHLVAWVPDLGHQLFLLILVLGHHADRGLILLTQHRLLLFRLTQGVAV